MENLNSNIILTDEELENICERYFISTEKCRNQKFQIISHDVKPLSETPVGYLAEHFVLKVLVAPENRELLFFVKKLPKNDYVQQINVFDKEIPLYEFLLPRLQDTPIGIAKWSASCYLTRNVELMVFENLLANGYCLAPSIDFTLDLEHLQIALRTVSRLHASSIIFEERTKITIPNHYPDYLIENAYPLDPNSVRYRNFQGCVLSLVAISQRLEKYSNAEKIVIKEKLPKALSKIFEFVQPSSEFRNVLNHGDLWKNNILFKYDDQDDDLQPVDALLCDFQLSRYAPPALDVMSLICITTNSDFRDKFLKEILDSYYDSFQAEVTHGEDQDHYTPDVITKQNFYKSCRHYHLAGLIESCLFNLVVLLPPHLSAEFVSKEENFEDFFKTKRMEMSLKAYDESELFRNRISDVLYQVIDKFVLQAFK